MTSSRTFGLSQNQIKVIAAVAMALDHIGAYILPQLVVLRIIGRLAFPVFSFAIYEGCQYTRHPARYLGMMFAMGLACMAVYCFFTDRIFDNILITFSLSICAVYSFQFCRDCFARKRSGRRLIGVLVFVSCLAGLYVTCLLIDVDYGFCGVILPLLAELSASIPTSSGHPSADYDSLKRKNMALIGFSAGLVLLSLQASWHIQFFCLAALPLLLLYNGRRGTFSMKYFFYIFYPVHLIVIWITELILTS